jgi:hypothetical protein
MKDPLIILLPLTPQGFTAGDANFPVAAQLRRKQAVII